MNPEIQLRMVSLGTAQELFKGREGFTVEDVLMAADAFHTYLVGADDEE